MLITRNRKEALELGEETDSNVYQISDRKYCVSTQNMKIIKLEMNIDNITYDKRINGIICIREMQAI